MPYADPEVRKQKDKEYKARPEVKERNNKLYRNRYAKDQGGIKTAKKQSHHFSWANLDYREKKKKAYYERWEKNWERQKIVQLKAKAKKMGIEFNIEESDIRLPEKCPIFGIDLVKSQGKQSNNSPSVDRIDPSKGYIKGNVVVVSNKANSIKREATIDELIKMVNFYVNLTHEDNTDE